MVPLAGARFGYLAGRARALIVPAGRTRGWVRWGLPGILAIGAGCVAYGCFVEPYWPEITHSRIVSARLRRGTRPIRIVLLSDLHSDPKPRLEDRLPQIVGALRPDIVVYTGDSLNSIGALPVFRRCMTRLAAIAPTFAVRGNWDAWYWRDVDLFGGTGVRELQGDAARVGVGESSVWIAGVGVGHESLARQALQPIPEGAPALFLYHYPYPDVLPDETGGKVDLYCAGHTHGGQVALPFYGAIMTLSKYGKKYESGLYRVGEFWLYVTRGIGMEGGGAPRVRFFARPEIAVIEIAPEESPIAGADPDHSRMSSSSTSR